MEELSYENEQWFKDLKEKFPDMEYDEYTVTITSKQDIPTREMEGPKTEVDGGEVEWHENHYKIYRNTKNVIDNILD